jgi:hypothetical protein
VVSIVDVREVLPDELLERRQFEKLEGSVLAQFGRTVGSLHSPELDISRYISG